ncbi:DNA polymerase IV [Prevotella brunnea]|uniref:DNA polymerase IV n=1 Tax=Prevotella brunnea TaxID=2508867 RepID=A0A5C8GGA6_9BACT|nr:DNA polymerase IV [Prevotella brunnea]MDR0186041.1 DNA polymerase IV [Prevotella brunnea]TXJ60816.1 DNA polymerase IV [Prevotella brunnea]
MRKIVHIDMDAFFASVEQRDCPELKGLPVAVSRDSSRSVVTTASYEARPFGVHSAMPIVQAKKRCPHLVIVEPHFLKYKEVSCQIHQIFHEYTDVVEPISLDEAFLDVTENKLGMEMAVDVARDIKRKIFERTQLTASAGISYNKFLAKIASDYRKPDGIFTVHPSNALAFIGKLPIEKFWGVGPKTALTMHKMGIYKGEQLRKVSLEHLMQVFGKSGKIYYDFVRGIDERPVLAYRERKSVGCERTFEEDITTKTRKIIELYYIAIELVKRIEKQDFSGKTLTLKVKWDANSQITRSITLDKPLRGKREILPLAKKLLKEADRNHRPIRLMGLSVSSAGSSSEADEHFSQWIEGELEFIDTP